MTRTKEECLRAAAHVVLMAAIRIEQERLDNESSSERVA